MTISYAQTAELTCPACGHEAQVDAPLLIHRLDADPRLIFSPAQQTTSEQDQEQAGSLYVSI